MAGNDTLAFGFTDGALEIIAPWADMRIEWRPPPRATEKLRRTRSRWQEFWPEFRLVRPPAAGALRSALTDIGTLPFHDRETRQTADQKANAFAQFRSEIPERFVSAVEPFRSHQWGLLKLLHEESTLRDLARANPVLAYCLANNGEFRGTSAKIAEQLAVPHSHSKQREILEWLGFAGTQATARLLKKILPAAVTPYAMRRLRSAQRDEMGMKLLVHQQQVGAGVLALACNGRAVGLVTPKLIEEVAGSGEEDTESPTADLLCHTLELLREMRGDRTLRPFRSRKRLRQVHDEVAEEYERFKQRVAAGLLVRVKARHAFSRPPVPGTEIIVPVVTEEELKEEGRNQGNCVASYAARVRRGGLYIYKVLAPQRATLSIMLGSDGCWHTHQLKRKGNRRVNSHTVGIVAHWLHEHALSV